MLNASAYEMVDARGPRYAVIGTVRQGESVVQYATTAEMAEKFHDDFKSRGYYMTKVHPPQDNIDLGQLGRDRTAAKKELDERTSILRAGVLRALEEGRAEAEIARTAQIDRMTVRDWAGK